MDAEPIDLRGARGVQVGDGNVQHNHYPATPVTWPHQVGVVPPLAGNRVSRDADRVLAEATATDATVIVCQVLSGLGGVGKTQLAANLAHHRRAGGEVDLLVWCTASSREQVVSTYTRAAADILGRDDPDRFLAWLSTTDKRWLIVLDDLGDPDHLRGLWPPAVENGRTVVTTRRRDATLHGDRRKLVPVGLYTPVEAMAYLRGRLGEDTGRLAEAAGLAADLGYLPLALGQAAAYMIDRELDCAAYRERFAARHHRLTELLPADARPDDYAGTVATTWSLSIEAADDLEPRGASRPLLEYACLLDPNGIPLDVLAVNATTRDALHNLRRLSLVDIVDQVVLVHGLVQRSVRDELSTAEQEAMAHILADRLNEIWPTPENNPELSQQLRANTATLRANTADALTVLPHPVLFHAGNSLGNTGQVTAAIDYFNKLNADCLRVLGPDHPDTLKARHNLASWRSEAGDPAGAAQAFAELLTDCLRVLGPDHPGTLTTGENLAYSRGVAGDLAGAAQDFADLLTDTLRVLGPDHPRTLMARHNLAYSRANAGDLAGAAQAYEEVLTDTLRVLGPDHPDTLRVRHNLAYCRGEAGDPGGAVQAFAELLTDQLRVLGPDHPGTLTTRGNIARYRGEAGDPGGAVQAFAELLTDQLRVLGPDHPGTLTTRSNLANSRANAGDLAGAVEAYEEVLADHLRVLGPDHPHILTIAGELVYWRRRIAET